MNLTPAQRTQLQHALEAAFPGQAAQQQLLKRGLDLPRLGTPLGLGGAGGCAYLIKSAEDAGKVDALIRAALELRAADPDLRALAQSLGLAPLPPAPVSTP